MGTMKIVTEPMTEFDDGLANVAMHLAAFFEATTDEDREDHEAAAVSELQKLTVRQRAMLASLVSAATNRSMSNQKLGEMGRFDKSAYSKKNTANARQLANQLELQKESAELLTKWLLARDGHVSYSDLEKEVLDRNKKIGKLRKKLSKAKRKADAKHEAAVMYLAAAHKEFHAQRQENLLEREEVVIDIERRGRLTPAPKEVSNDDDK